MGIFVWEEFGSFFGRGVVWFGYKEIMVRKEGRRL